MTFTLELLREKLSSFWHRNNIFMSFFLSSSFHDSQPEWIQCCDYVKKSEYFAYILCFCLEISGQYTLALNELSKSMSLESKSYHCFYHTWDQFFRYFSSNTFSLFTFNNEQHILFVESLLLIASASTESAST